MNTEEIMIYVAIGLLYVLAVGMIISLVSDAIITDRKKDRTLRTHAAREQWIEDMSNYYGGDADEAIEDMVDKPGYEWLKVYRGCSCPTLWLDHGAESCVCGYEDRMNA